MNRIDKYNYEAFFLDYHEGSLNSEEKQMVMAFLQENPDYYDEFEDFINFALPVPEIKYPDKSELFRTDLSVPESNEWEYMCIAYMEGDLDDEDLKKFERELESDPGKAKVLNLYMATKSLPDENIEFENRSALKKKVVLIPRWIYGAVSAAAIIILGWIIFMPGGSEPDRPVMADEKSRETIYIDKLSHPGKNEIIASTDTGTKVLKKSSSIFFDYSLSGESEEFEEDLISREAVVMAALISSKPVAVEAGNYEIPASSNVFAYRSIPGAEDDEYQTLLAFTGDFIRKQILDQDPELVKKSKFSFWELADAGLEKISNIFGTRADIEREYSESGELLAVTFESPLVGFNTPIKRKSAAQID